MLVGRCGYQAGREAAGLGPLRAFMNKKGAYCNGEIH